MNIIYNFVVLKIYDGFQSGMRQVLITALFNTIHSIFPQLNKVYKLQKV